MSVDDGLNPATLNAIDEFLAARAGVRQQLDALNSAEKDQPRAIGGRIKEDDK